jgi:hypothetical protein
MRPSFRLQKTRGVQVAAGALTLIVPASAYALTTGSTNALAGPAQMQAAPKFKVASHHVGYGDPFTVTGRAPAIDAGHQLTLQYSGVGRTWHDVATTTIGTRGGFRFRASLQHNGLLRVLGRTGFFAASAARSTAPVTFAPSRPRRVRVAARFAVAAGQHTALGGQTVDVRGHLEPGARGRVVKLDARTGRHWRTIASARTGRWGGFDFRAAPAAGQEHLRVRFAGDFANARATANAGSLTAMRPSVASWYNDGGNTACGFHAYYGVANKVLPCGTKVTFTYGGRTVTATVDDRGPFVAGREWDLNQNTAGALGFGGVATVWSSI